MRGLLLVVALLLQPWSAQTAPLKNNSVVIVHASRWYHTNPETIDETNKIVNVARAQDHDVVALWQKDISSDPLWYAYRDTIHITQSFYSRAGEHHLVPLMPVHGTDFHVTFVGGYHSACLGWAMAELVSRFIHENRQGNLEIILPMKAIFTGYRFAHGELLPRTPYEEANTDDSIDGLNLFKATEKMSDGEWRKFMMESLRLAVFEKHPLSSMDWGDVRFALMRDGRVIDTWPSNTHDPAHNVILHYFGQLIH